MSGNKNFYINLTLFVVVAVLLVNSLSPQGHLLINKALAVVGLISGDGTVNFLARFAGAQNPSNQIGNSIIFDNGTNVGIGTTSPSSKLDVFGDIRVSGTGDPVVIYSSRVGAETNLALYADGGIILNMDRDNDSAGEGLYIRKDAGTDLMTILESGNVGIGTTSPTEKLDVFGNIRLSGAGGSEAAITARSAAGESNLGFYADGGIVLNLDRDNDSAGEGLYIRKDAGTELLAILENGNVGIGTTGPKAKLEVNGAIMLTPLSSDPSGLQNGMMWMRQ